MNADRVIADIGGYSSYVGLREARLHSSCRHDLPAMCRALLKGGQQLDPARYFTARVRNDPAAAKRRPSVIDALTARGGIETDSGHFISEARRRKNCGHTWRQSEEKKTDVNIAVRLLDDACDDRFDTVLDPLSGTRGFVVG